MTTQSSSSPSAPGTILTYTGKLINVVDPDPSTIDPIDIAHHLSMLCRFGGAVPIFYSVAQHSVLVSAAYKDPFNKLIALLHDAAEAYLLDVPRPIKSLPAMDQYRELEHSLLQRIISALAMQGKYATMHPEAVTEILADISTVDSRMCATEAKCLTSRTLHDLDAAGIHPYPDVHIEPWDQRTAEDLWIAAYNYVAPVRISKSSSTWFARRHCVPPTSVSLSRASAYVRSLSIA